MGPSPERWPSGPPAAEGGVPLFPSPLSICGGRETGPARGREAGAALPGRGRDRKRRRAFPGVGCPRSAPTPSPPEAELLTQRQSPRCRTGAARAQLAEAVKERGEGRWGGCWRPRATSLHGDEGGEFPKEMGGGRR